MLKWLGIILLLALIVALITVPSQKKFEKFAEGKVNTSACKPLLIFQGYKIFSIGYVSECGDISKIYDPKTGNYIKTNIGVPVYGKRQKYLGLFGKFWKL